MKIHRNLIGINSDDRPSMIPKNLKNLDLLTLYTAKFTMLIAGRRGNRGYTERGE